MGETGGSLGWGGGQAGPFLFSLIPFGPQLPQQLVSLLCGPPPAAPPPSGQSPGSFELLLGVGWPDSIKGTG